MRTLTELENALASDLAWRRTEMQSMLSAVRSNTGPAGSSFRRGGIAMLYAHWEGYTKLALANYWKYVARRKLSYGDLSINFVALGVERELLRDQGSSATEKQIARVRRISECDSDRALMTDREVDTRSNLNSEVLDELLMKLGLDAQAFATSQRFIDYTLLRTRNTVAHGEYLDVTIEAYNESHQKVLSLMEDVRTAVSNAANTNAYRR